MKLLIFVSISLFLTACANDPASNRAFLQALSAQSGSSSSYSGGGFASGFDQGVRNATAAMNRQYALAPATGCRTSYDATAGNSYRVCPNSSGGGRIYGSNAATGARWSTIVSANGDRQGVDARGNRWVYNRTTSRYYNYGTGVSCYGNGAARRCN